MTTEINLGNLVIPIIKPQKGTDYYTEAEKQELISIVTNNVNSVIMPQEQTRQENEATRQSNEETRQSQENTRQSNEVSRQTAESARVEAENLRQSNESSRISAEQARVETFNTKMQAVDTAIGGIHTSQDAYDQNAQNKTEAFNTNATNKMNAYNENASEKIAEYDEHVHDYETELANKVDKVPGKGLSTNDYDNTEKGKVQANTEARHTHSNKSVLDGTTASYTTEKDQKLDGLENYDDTELREDIEQNRTSIEENYKVITKLQEDVEDLTERVEDAENNEMTYTPEKATSHYLQDSADSRFRKFIPIGRTTQESTTGKNLLPVEEILTFTTFKNINVNIPAGTYKVTCSSLTSQGTDGVVAAFGTNAVWLSSTQEKNVTLQNDITQITIYSNGYSYDNSQGKSATIKQLMVSVSGGTYEPYTGGEPAPNPIYPFPIKNTGDSGSVNEKVQNENLLPFTNQDFTVNNVRYYVQDGSLYFNGTSTRETNSNNINFKNNFNFILEAGTYKISHKTGVNAVYLYNYDNDSSSLITLGTDTSSQSLTLTQKTKLYIGFYVYQKVFNNVNVEIQIEKSSTATDYVPHSEQNISFPLAQGQKFYEGSHPDDDEKVHHKRMQIVLDGSDDENWNLISTDNYRRFYIPVNTPLGKIGGRWEYRDFANHIANEFLSQYGYGENLKSFVQISNVNNVGFTDYNSKFADVTALKEYLRENPLIVEYELAEEQTENFTEEQKTAWKEWKKARTYKNVTHISSEDETPANVEIEYVQDTKTYIDNKVTALTNAIISLGGNI
jgi:hypothetical protein